METKQSEAGFTLLEIMIAVAIMTMAFAAILQTQSKAIDLSIKAKRSNIVAMLAKQAMVQAEVELEGKTFEEVGKELEGKFDSPYEEYRWKREIKEVNFPNLPMAGDEESGGPISGYLVRMTKLLAKYMSDSLREISVSIIWKKGDKDRSFTVATYWVNLEKEFSLNE